MKIRLLLVTLGLAVAPSLFAQNPTPKRDFNTPIGDAMDKMRTANQGLGAQLADASKNADSLARLATIKTQAAEAKKHEPVRAAEAEDKAAFMTNYRSDMDKFIAQIEKVEAALKANNNAEAEKLFNEAANTQKAGHKSYKKGKAGAKKG
jgi:soluble cytochrome b562